VIWRNGGKFVNGRINFGKSCSFFHKNFDNLTKIDVFGQQMCEGIHFALMKPKAENTSF